MENCPATFTTIRLSSISTSGFSGIILVISSSLTLSSSEMSLYTMATSGLIIGTVVFVSYSSANSSADNTRPPIVMNSSEEQPSNTSQPTVFGVPSKATDLSSLQSMKALLPSFSRDAGIVISSKPQASNPLSPILTSPSGNEI